MFTGIIESLGTVTGLQKQDSNLHISIQCDFAGELKADQSVSHNGVCLTVTKLLNNNQYTTTAIDETLQKTNLGDLKINDKVNLERAMLLSARIDGHLVQGHVDCTAVCINTEDKNGSHLFTFELDAAPQFPMIDKGSVCINGVSLTVVEVKDKIFSAAIIPYTFSHTNFHALKINDRVNIEFDMMGKYVQKVLKG